jgi:hypothetical protein
MANIPQDSLSDFAHILTMISAKRVDPASGERIRKDVDQVMRCVTLDDAEGFESAFHSLETYYMSFLSPPRGSMWSDDDDDEGPYDDLLPALLNHTIFLVNERIADDRA